MLENKHIIVYRMEKQDVFLCGQKHLAYLYESNYNLETQL